MKKDFILKRNDKVYYRNTFGNYCFHNVPFVLDGSTIKEYERIKNIKVMKVERTTIDIVYEVKEILDEKEKEYLSRVIEPFRDNVKGVTKYSSFVNCVEYKEWIVIEIRSGEEIIFPRFPQKKMYKGMSLNREYTLKELGL